MLIPYQGHTKNAQGMAGTGMAATLAASLRILTPRPSRVADTETGTNKNNVATSPLLQVIPLPLEVITASGRRGPMIRLKLETGVPRLYPALPARLSAMCLATSLLPPGHGKSISS